MRFGRPIEIHYLCLQLLEMLRNSERVVISSIFQSRKSIQEQRCTLFFFPVSGLSAQHCTYMQGMLTIWFTNRLILLGTVVRYRLIHWQTSLAPYDFSSRPRCKCRRLHWAAGGAGGPKAYLAHLALAACAFVSPPSVTNTAPLTCSPGC